MKGKKDSKSNKISGKKGKKKISTAKAITLTLKNKQPKLSKSLDKTNISNKGITIIANNINTIDLKSKMTEKELFFLEIYLAGDISLEDAMIQAGYDNYQKSSLNTIARRIVQKHEAQTEDARILARAMGMGEIRVFKVLLDLMQSRVERIKLDATMYLGKVLGLTKDQVEGQTGITIVFEAPGQAAQPAALAMPTQGKEQVHPLPYAGKVLQITE